MQFLAQFLVAVSRRLNSIALWGAVSAVCVMIFAIMWQVVARYLFASPPIWTEELARYAMVWAGMLGASCAFYAHTDPTLFPGARNQKGTLGKVYAALRAGGVFFFVLPVLWFSFIGPTGGFARGFIARSTARTAEMTGIPMIWFSVAIPIAFALILIHAIADMARYSASLETQDQD